MKRLSPWLPLLLAVAFVPTVGCERPDATSQATSATATSPIATTTAAAVGASAQPATSATARAITSGDTEAGPPALSRKAFGELVNRLSENDAEFFSDNYVSNETSYLQVAPQLIEHMPRGGVYLGVGPEQNFSYLALGRPSMAFIVDIRRDNLLLHLLYKAAFEEAESRSQFLALLLGRRHLAEGAPDADAPLADVLAHAEKAPAEGKDFKAIHGQLMKVIAQYQVKLSKRDRHRLKRTHRAFFRKGLALKFELKEKSFRRYPSLRKQLAARDLAGRQRSFLATGKAFDLLRRMQRENRIIPLVGNFAGDHALPKLASHLKETGQTLSAFYVSNVEQYLLADGLWWKWQRNVAAFPISDKSIFIRAYLDQGAAHPRQQSGHRSATVLQRIGDFLAHKKPYRSMLALATDRMLGSAPASGKADHAKP